MRRDEIIEEMKRRLVEKFHPEAIILFGSSARGEAREDSDIDLPECAEGSKGGVLQC